MTHYDIQTRTDEAWADNNLSASAIFWNKKNHGGLFRVHSNQGRTTMKLATIALASAFALSSTFAFASTSHHKRTHSAAHSSKYRSSYGQYYGNPNNRGGLVGGSDAGGWNTGTGGYGRYYGNPNDRGGLVGGSDSGTYRP
jgi:hypothetical protein